MASGGPRNRSGPQPDPNSLRGASRAALRVLPSTPYNRAYPPIPLKDATSRETDLWNTAWTSPQAWAWIEEPWRWQTIAIWVRRTALAESGEANASDINAMIRLGDQIGMTPAGLKENGWAIGAAAEPRTEQERSTAARASSRNRLRVVSGEGAA